MATLKVLVVGDAEVGKTSLLLSFTSGAVREALSFAEGSYEPTVFDTFEAKYEYTSADAGAKTEQLKLELFDTSGSPDYDRLRPISYASGPDVVLVCFSAVNPSSLENVQHKWVPEVKRQLGQSAKFVLVGCKCDAKAALLLGPEVLRIALGRAPDDDASKDDSGTANASAPAAAAVDIEEAARLGRKLGATTALECSAKTGLGLRAVMDAAIATARGILKPPSTATGLAALELKLDLDLERNPTPTSDTGFSGKPRRRRRGSQSASSSSSSPIRSLALDLSPTQKLANAFDTISESSRELIRILRRVVVRQGDGTRRAASIIEVSIYGKYKVIYEDDGNEGNYIKPKKIASFYYYNSTDTIDSEKLSASNGTTLLLDKIQELLSEGADVNAALEGDSESTTASPLVSPPSGGPLQPKRRTPLYWAAASGAPADVAELLLQRGAEAKGIDLSRYTKPDKPQRRLTPLASEMAKSMLASDTKHPLLSAAVEVWKLESQLRNVLNKRGVRRNADGRLRMASSPRRRGSSRRASLSSDMSSSSSDDSEDEIGSFIKRSSVHEGVDTSPTTSRFSSSAPVSPLKPLRVRALQTEDSPDRAVNSAPSSPPKKLSLVVGAIGRITNFAKAKKKEFMPTPRANKAESWRMSSAADKFFSDEEDDDDEGDVDSSGQSADPLDLSSDPQEVSADPLDLEEALVSPLRAQRARSYSADEELSVESSRNANTLQNNFSNEQHAEDQGGSSEVPQDGTRSDEEDASDAGQEKAAEACLKVVNDHVAATTGGGRVVLLLRLDRARSCSLFKFPSFQDVANSDADRGTDALPAAERQLRSTPRCVAVFEMPPERLLGSRVDHVKATLEAQGPLRFSDDERRSFEGKASFDALSLSTPVHVRLPTSTEQDPGTEPGDAAPGVIVAKIEIGTLKKKLLGGDPRLVSLMRGHGAEVVAAGSTSDGLKLVAMVQDDFNRFMARPGFVLTLANMTRGIVNKLRSAATPLIARQKQQHAARAQSQSNRSDEKGSGGSTTGRLTKADKKAQAKARRALKKKAKREAAKRANAAVKDLLSTGPAVDDTKVSSVPCAEQLRKEFAAAELRCMFELVAHNCTIIATILAPSIADQGHSASSTQEADAWKKAWIDSWGHVDKLAKFRQETLRAFQDQMIRELLQQTLSMLNINTVEEKKQLEDHPLSSHYKFGKFSDILKRWEESCTVKKSMAAVKALEDPSAALRQKLVNAWELQLRERSLRKLCERSSVATSQRNGGALPRTARRGRRKSNASIAAAAVAKLFDTTSSMDQECDSSGEVVAEETITLKPSPGLTSLLGQLDQHAKHVDADAVLFATQTGSAMYNLATNASDKDYLIVYLKRPTLEYIQQEATALTSNKKPAADFVLHPSGEQKFASDKSGVIEGRAIELSKYIADMCKGNPTGIEPLLLSHHMMQSASFECLRPVQTSWVWQELCKLHTMRCFKTRRCLAQYAGFAGERLRKARSELERASQSPDGLSASAQKRCAKYLYHALHKVYSLEAALDGRVPNVWFRNGSAEYLHVMRVRRVDAEVSLDEEYQKLEDRLQSAQKRIEADTNLPDEADFDALAKWVVSVHVRFLNHEKQLQSVPDTTSEEAGGLDTFDPAALRAKLVASMDQQASSVDVKDSTSKPSTHDDSADNPAPKDADLEDAAASVASADGTAAARSSQTDGRRSGTEVTREAAAAIIRQRTGELLRSLKREFGAEDVETMIAMGIPPLSTSLLRQCGGSGSQACAYYFSHLDAELERVAAVKAGWLTEAFSSSDSQPDLSQDVITKLISESYDPQNHITDVADFYDGWSDEEDESGAPADKAPESSTATHGAAETAVSDVQSSKPSTDAYNAGHITNVAEFYEGWSSDEGDAADDKDDGNNSTPQPASEEFPVLNDDTAGVSQGRKSPAHSQLHEFLASPSLGLEHLYDVFISGGVTSVEDFADIEGGAEELVDDFGITQQEASSILHHASKACTSTPVSSAAPSPASTRSHTRSHSFALPSDDESVDAVERVQPALSSERAPLTPNRAAAVATEKEVRAILKATEESYHRQLVAHKQAAAKELDDAVAMAHQAVRQTQQAWAGRVAGMEAANAMQKRENKRLKNELAAAQEEIRALRAALKIAQDREK